MSESNSQWLDLDADRLKIGVHNLSGEKIWIEVNPILNPPKVDSKDVGKPDQEKEQKNVVNESETKNTVLISDVM